MSRGLLIVLCACNAPMASSVAPDAAVASVSDVDAPGVVERLPLEVHALGVQGFVLRHGSDAVMTAPLFTRQSAIDVTFNVSLAADAHAIDAGLADESLADVRAIVTGHAHYDHLIDVPLIAAHAPGALVATNLTGRHVLAALAPDRPGCTNAPAGADAGAPLARDRVIAMDDTLASHVDYTNCPAQRPPGAPLEGTWLAVPNSRVRLKALCSQHPPQVGPYHFGEGSIDADRCELPRAASGWLEGRTLAFVIDFLDDTGAPAFRVYYQDAPADPPLGQLPPALLAEREIDLALLCVGSADAVADHPAAILASTAPRLAISGHWEDFFQPATAAPEPLPLLDLDGYLARAEAALPGHHVLAQPGSRFVVAPAP